VINDILDSPRSKPELVIDLPVGFWRVWWKSGGDAGFARLGKTHRNDGSPIPPDAQCFLAMGQACQVYDLVATGDVHAAGEILIQVHCDAPQAEPAASVSREDTVWNPGREQTRCSRSSARPTPRTTREYGGTGLGLAISSNWFNDGRKIASTVKWARARRSGHGGFAARPAAACRRRLRLDLQDFAS